MDNRHIEKKYQVFISSTYRDLVEERNKVIDVLLSTSKCIPCGMEFFPAEDDEQFNVIKRIIDICDFYILIIGSHYGSINRKMDLSFTEMEFDYAVSKDIPILVFVRDNSLDYSSGEDDHSKTKLGLFREKVMKDRIVKKWSDVNSLEKGVLTSIAYAIEKYNRPGWIKYADYLYENFIIFPDKKAHLDMYIENKLCSENAAKVKIICFGSSLYGHIMEKIAIEYNHIEMEVVAYTPFDRYPGHKSSRRFLVRGIKNMLEKTTAKVYLTKIFPTIRAILICDKNDNPLFCTIQPYYIYNDEFAYVKGDGYTPSFFADENNKLLISKLTKTFMDEFIRLKGNKDKPETIEEIERSIFINKLKIE